ncbi:MAG: DUF2147 domain-containing protein [Bacteroidetes bacterium]|nr:DUF2147 domain-containing protein [Bacteroidota bacterium]
MRWGLILMASLLSMCYSPLFAQKDKLEGLWYNEEKSAKIDIYKAVDGYYWGKIVWLKEPNRDGKPKLDIKNSKEKLRTRPIMNMPILSRFTKDGDNTYDGGEIYDPKNGKTYSCTITYRNDNELGIRGYIGISLIGRTTTWTRAKD